MSLFWDITTIRIGVLHNIFSFPPVKFTLCTSQVREKFCYSVTIVLLIYRFCYYHYCVCWYCVRKYCDCCLAYSRHNPLAGNKGMPILIVCQPRRTHSTHDKLVSDYRSGICPIVIQNFLLSQLYVAIYCIQYNTHWIH